MTEPVWTRAEFTGAGCRSALASQPDRPSVSGPEQYLPLPDTGWQPWCSYGSARSKSAGAGARSVAVIGSISGAAYGPLSNPVMK